MQAVSNQQSYEKLIPVPLVEEGWPILSKIFLKTLVAITITGAAVALGATIGLAEIGITVLDAAICGGLVGVIASIFFIIYAPISNRLSQYRLDTLAQMEKVIVVTEKVQSAFSALKYFLSYPLESFSQTYQNNTLHDAVTTITTRISPERPDAKAVWKVFLEKLHKRKVINADGAPIELDFSIELARLEGKQISVGIESLKGFWSSPSDEDLEQIEELKKICFGKVGAFTQDQLKAYLQEPDSGCLVARNQETKQILGFAMYAQRDEGVVISGIAHTPGAANLGIGGNLLQGVIQAQKNGQPLFLQVRKSNPAVHFYEKWWFKINKVLPNYYSEGPAEDAYLMELDWGKYNEAASKQVA